ncbi:hypothetical protein FYO98_19715 [Salmonella enterica]|nr:hypothetical protein [Salmonella enterica]ECK2646596.1 hypothetical protein [Salmonella enterica]ECK5795430.1 hypothetical protein [Salmonella enterica]ECP1022632.1 hypothetical protein [Salmonella enterica]ECP2557090.1 hypothetical protein [Salmonella enterica]
MPCAGNNVRDRRVVLVGLFFVIRYSLFVIRYSLFSFIFCCFYFFLFSFLFLLLAGLRWFTY